MRGLNRHVDDAEHPDRELLRAIQLPEPVPQPLAAICALAHELLTEDPVDDVGEHRPTPLVVGLARPSSIVIPENRGRSGRVRTAEALPPGGGPSRRDRREDQVNVDCRDPHGG